MTDIRFSYLASAEIVHHRTHGKMTFPVVALPYSFHSPCPQKMSYDSRFEYMQDLDVTSVGLDCKVHEKKREIISSTPLQEWCLLSVSQPDI